jgi:hypothetical protein
MIPGFTHNYFVIIRFAKVKKAQIIESKCDIGREPKEKNQ